MTDQRPRCESILETIGGGYLVCELWHRHPGQHAAGPTTWLSLRAPEDEVAALRERLRVLTEAARAACREYPRDEFAPSWVRALRGVLDDPAALARAARLVRAALARAQRPPRHAQEVGTVETG